MFRLFLLLIIVSYSNIIAHDKTLNSNAWDTKRIAQMFIDGTDDTIPIRVIASCSSQQIEQIEQLGKALIAKKYFKKMGLKNFWLPVVLQVTCSTVLERCMSAVLRNNGLVHSDSPCFCDAEGKMNNETVCSVVDLLHIPVLGWIAMRDNFCGVDCEIREFKLSVSRMTSRFVHAPSGSHEVPITQSKLSKSEKVCALLGRGCLFLWGN